MKEDRIYLLHIADALADIQEYTKIGRDDFFSRKLVQDAVIRNLEIIGEAVKNISKSTKEAHQDIPWKQIAGLRDILIHHYFGVDLEAIWMVVEHRLPTLSLHISSMLQ